MITTTNKQPLIEKLNQGNTISFWVQNFLTDRKVQGLSVNTLDYYRRKMRQFVAFCHENEIVYIDEIRPETIRRYLIRLEELGHNPGGIHQGYRTVKAFLRWYEAEEEPEGWKNPIRKIKAPKLNIEPLQPVEIETIKKMLATCDRGTFAGERDRAVLLSLLDTGCRADEFVNISLEDIDIPSGTILVRKGKGGKFRNVFIGTLSRKAVRTYLKKRDDDCPYLWVSEKGEKLQYWGLREIVRRRSQKAGVETPGIHDFRRAFALNFLRNNPGEIYSLQKLMGHSDLQVLRRYLAQTDEDIADAHRRGGPVDRAF